MSAFCSEHQHKEPCPVCAQDRQPPAGRARSVTRQLPNLPVPITDREIWIVVRASLLAIVKGIEMLPQRSALAIIVRAELLAIIAVIERRWGLKRKEMTQKGI